MWKKFIIILVGFLSGFISGFFAAGGGMVLVAAYIYLFKLDEIEARTTSIFTVFPMIFVSSIVYFKDNFIDWKAGILCAIGGIIGGTIGAKLLKRIPEKFLKIFFIMFLVYSSIRMIFF